MERQYYCTTKYTTQDSLESPKRHWEVSISTYGWQQDRAQKYINELTRLELLEANPYISNPAVVDWNGEVIMTPVNGTVTLYNKLNPKYKSIVDGWEHQEGEWSFEQQKAMRTLNGLDDPYEMTIASWGQLVIALTGGYDSKLHWTDVFGATYQIINTQEVDERF